MKILKKLLLFGLFSFCFCISANADVILPELPFDKENTSYIVDYNQNFEYVYVGYCKGTNYSLGSTSTYSSISTPYVYGFRYCIDENGNLSSMYRRRLETPEITADIYNDTLDLSSYSWGSESSGSSYGINLYYVQELERLQILSDGQIASQDIYNSPIIEGNMDVYLRSSSDNFAFKVFDKSVLNVPDEENVCDRTAVLGAVSNVNEIKLNVKGDTSVFYPLKGTFTLSYNSDNAFTTDDFNVELINNSDISVVGYYNLKCPDDAYACYLNYEYSSMDDIIETIDFSFRIKLSNNGVISFMRLYACVTNDDYTNISYDYVNASSDGVTNIPNTDNFLQDGNINDASGTAGGFFENFTDNDYGLSSIITIPLTSVQKLTNSSCSPISFPIPFTNKNIELPCMTSLYEQNIPLLLNIWQIVSFGIISYAIIVDIFGLVKKFKDPNDDKLEVMDL